MDNSLKSRIDGAFHLDKEQSKINHFMFAPHRKTGIFFNETKNSVKKGNFYTKLRKY